MSKSGGKKVVILGGGVAGMSAAHELVERGFRVEVFERKAIPGGKARSTQVTGRALRGSVERAQTSPSADRDPLRPPLPGEHGFRFFPGFYKHVIDTMDRIPYEGGSVSQNLVATREVRMARFDRSSFVLPSEFPRSTGDLRIGLSTVVALLSGQTGVPPNDALFFADKSWQFLTSCEERRLIEYERVNWWDFIEADNRSGAYQKYFGNAFTRSLVAAKAQRASAKTVGDMFMQMLFGVLLPGVPADRLLNGPTNDVWIDPWLAYLRARGVDYHLNADVGEIRFERGAVRSARVTIGGEPREVTGDFFIAAIPVERMAALTTQNLREGDASLANLELLAEYVEWMNGIQFYLTKDVPIARGHTIYVDSPWALTSVSQQQFWRHFDLSRYGDGRVKGLLSVDISDWDVQGLNGKEARRCTREEIAAEVWEELKRSLNVDGQEILSDGQLHSFFLDPDIANADPATPRIETDAEPLLVNYVDTWRLRPEASTRIPNFFLASDYVRTYTDLATMEAANEAARRAVNGVIWASGADVPPCAIWNLHEPEVFLPLRAHDRMRFRQGLPWSDGPLGLVRSVLGAQPDASEGASGAADVQAAAAARASGDTGLPQLRIVRDVR
ncbi:MAG: FAD-dependent oxidoreductase [Polyangiaceae bacterium]|jgi:uncharacterized protein with NAD-binding domain and iron-sulfur cluster